MGSISLHGVHMKLLAVDILSLAIKPAPPRSFTHRTGLQITRVEILGTVVLRNRREKFLRFNVDDGTGCVPCILWLNHRPCAVNPNIELLADAALDFAGMVELGKMVRVRGKLSFYRGEIQVTVKDVFVEVDPNSEVLHSLECIRLARRCYNL